MSIKNLKPNSKSRFKQGYYDVSESLKYSGKGEVIFRSGLEKKFFDFFENSEKVVKWESEPELAIKYFYNGKERTYWVDARIMFKETKWLAEIKPFAQTQPPKTASNPITSQKLLATFEQNIAKWTAAKQWCEANGYEFCILTEKFFDR